MYGWVNRKMPRTPLDHVTVQSVMYGWVTLVLVLLALVVVLSFIVDLHVYTVLVMLGLWGCSRVARWRTV